MPNAIPRPLVRTNQWTIVLSVLTAWITGYYVILALPLLSGVLGLVWGYNPVMRIARLFLRQAPSSYIPEDAEQQKFNQVIAVTFLAIGLVGFLMNWTVFAFISTALVALSAIIAILGFCVGCFIRYQWMMFKHRRQAHHLS